MYRLIDEDCPNNKQYYSRIVRAQLSNSELCMLAYNCIVGEGRFKFSKLVSKYSVLHNIHREGLDEYSRAELAFFIRKLPAESFRFDPITPITYDD